MLGQRCHNLFRVMCINIKEVKTTYSKGSVKQEDELSPPPVRQHWTTHHSVNKGGNCNNEVGCSPSPILSPDLATSNFHLFSP